METRAQLVNEIEGDEFHLSPIPGKMMLNDIESIFLEGKVISLDEFREEFSEVCRRNQRNSLVDEMFHDLHDFIFTDPKASGY